MIKYGGNAMINEEVKTSVISNIAELQKLGYRIVIVHGGGPFIKSILKKVKIESEFIAGHRKTSKEAIKYIEMTLRGEVNTEIVMLLNNKGRKAVGLSGKDAGLAIAKRRYHIEKGNKVDLGLVGDIEKVDPQIIYDLLEKNYTPVIACIAADKKGNTYNVNADMMAGAIAGALKADEYIVLTDTDGLRKDKDDAASLIENITTVEVQKLFGSSIVEGMIPKIESCQIALKSGASKARIINGTEIDVLLKALDQNTAKGTIISK